MMVPQVPVFRLSWETEFGEGPLRNARRIPNTGIS
jgi:hypothetical protein